MAHYIDYQQTDGSTPVATLNRVGSVKPDGTSIDISANGTISTVPNIANWSSNVTNCFVDGTPVSVSGQNVSFTDKLRLKSGKNIKEFNSSFDTVLSSGLTGLGALIWSNIYGIAVSDVLQINYAKTENEKHTFTNTGFCFVFSSSKWYITTDNGNSWSETEYYILGYGFYNTSTGFSSFVPTCSNKIITSNDTSYISIQAMPSSKYIDLTLGAVGSEYTAPANGYVTINRQCTSNDGYVQLAGDVGTDVYGTVTCGDSWAGGATYLKCFIPVKKGKRFSVFYKNITNLGIFRFTYAEGEQ